MGLTTSGTISAMTAMTLEQSVERTRVIAEAAKSENSNVLVLCHGGPIADPEDAQHVFDRVAAVDGFYGASSVERLPTERAITGQVKVFKELRGNQFGKSSR